MISNQHLDVTITNRSHLLTGASEQILFTYSNHPQRKASIYYNLILFVLKCKMRFSKCTLVGLYGGKYSCYRYNSYGFIPNKLGRLPMEEEKYSFFNTSHIPKEVNLHQIWFSTKEIQSSIQKWTS